MINNPKPYLLLDIDGVLNIFPPQNNFKHGKHNKFWGDWVKKSFTHNGEDFPFVYSASMIIAVNNLRKHYDIIWLTTWQDLANTMFSELVETDVLVSPFIERTNFDKANSSSIFAKGFRTWWKISDLEDFITKNARNFLWLDDEYSKDIRREVERIAFINDVNGKLYPIYEGRGISPCDIDKVIEYALSLKEAKR